jgi:hypothetical protein
MNDKKQTFSFEELLTAQMLQLDAVAQVLVQNAILQ